MNTFAEHCFLFVHTWSHSPKSRLQVDRELATALRTANTDTSRRLTVVHAYHTTKLTATFQHCRFTYYSVLRTTMSCCVYFRSKTFAQALSTPLHYRIAMYVRFSMDHSSSIRGRLVGHGKPHRAELRVQRLDEI